MLQYDAIGKRTRSTASVRPCIMKLMVTLLYYQAVRIRLSQRRMRRLLFWENNGPAVPMSVLTADEAAASAKE